jgi:hypothetical protein
MNPFNLFKLYKVDLESKQEKKKNDLLSKIKMKDANNDFNEHLSNRIKQFEIDQNRVLLKLEQENKERLYNIYKDIRNYKQLNENQMKFILNLNHDEKDKILDLFNEMIHILSDIITQTHYKNYF